MINGRLEMKPRGAGQLVDAGVALYRANFASVFVFAFFIGGLADIAVYLIGAAVNPQSLVLGDAAGMMRNIIEYGFEDFADMYSDIFSNPYGMSSMLYAVYAAYGIKYMLITPFVNAGICSAAIKYCNGENPAPGAHLKKTLKSYVKIIVTGLCMSILLTGLFIGMYILIIIAVIPFSLFFGMSGTFGGTAATVTLIIIVAMIMLVFAAGILIIYTCSGLLFPVCFEENRFFFSATGRAIKLAFSRFFKAVWVSALAYAVVAAVSIGISSLLILIGSAIPVTNTPLDTVVMVLRAVIGVAAGALFAPVPVLTFTALYYDIRTVREGYDVEKAIKSLQ